VPLCDGAEITESGVTAGEAEGVLFLRNEDDAAVFELGAGEYSFVARWEKG
jgi:hypothetical protein